MCGILFCAQSPNRKTISREKFYSALQLQKWRGPDHSEMISCRNNLVFLGHNRLAIQDLQDRSNQPMLSKCGTYYIIFNGEIYNHFELRKDINHNFVTQSDTETLLEGFIQYGVDFICKLNGMFAFVIFNNIDGSWIAARDHHGIKPLFCSITDTNTVISSESISIRSLIDCQTDVNSIAEWKFIRRPIPGKTFFSNIKEILPGTWINSNGKVGVYYKRTPSSDIFDQEHLESLITSSVKLHELSDVTNVSLLSGGLDCAIITALSNVTKAYSVGMPNNNEFADAMETAKILNLKLTTVNVTPESMIDSWRHLVRLRGEPISVPNEGLIYILCSKFESGEKVAFSGEGADEIFFGYEKIFRAASFDNDFSIRGFLKNYSYVNSNEIPERLLDYISDSSKFKSIIEFTEDFFYDVHLTGLLRRMDASSMAASIEVRVPFVSPSVINYMYRRPKSLRINNSHSKIPLRSFAKNLGLSPILDRKKIGFDARIDTLMDRVESYSFFRHVVLQEFL